MNIYVYIHVCIHISGDIYGLILVDAGAQSNESERERERDIDAWR